MSGHNRSDDHEYTPLHIRECMAAGVRTPEEAVNGSGIGLLLGTAAEEPWMMIARMKFGGVPRMQLSCDHRRVLSDEATSAASRVSVKLNK